MSLAINPSYRTQETVYDSCPCGSASDCTTDEALQWCNNVPKIHGNSMLGTYGATNMRFGHPTLKCNSCNQCRDNAVTPLFYRPVRPIIHPTYGFQYMGKDHYYRKPY